MNTCFLASQKSGQPQSKGKQEGNANNFTTAKLQGPTACTTQLDRTICPGKPSDLLEILPANAHLVLRESDESLIPASTVAALAKKGVRVSCIERQGHHLSFPARLVRATIKGQRYLLTLELLNGSLRRTSPE